MIPNLGNHTVQMDGSPESDVRRERLIRFAQELTADAEKRVDEVVAQVDAAAVKAREAADAARKAGLWTAFAAFLALLIGAFIAAVSASLGGHLRDDPQTLR